MGPLTTLANVKAYLAITSAGSDALITQLIPRESGLIETYTQRTYPSALNIRKRLNGNGGATILLPSTPIIEVTAVEVNGAALTASDGRTTGYIYEQDGSALTFVGGKFPFGQQNVVVTWRSGYRNEESAEVPAPEGNATTSAYTPTYVGRAVYDAGVVGEDGEAFASVANSPLAGQYAFSGGTYTFNAANAGQTVTMSYDYVPAQVEQACIEMVGLDLKQRDNIGIRSKTLAGESVSYEDKGMTASIREMLAPFRRRAPL